MKVGSSAFKLIAVLALVALAILFAGSWLFLGAPFARLRGIENNVLGPPCAPGDVVDHVIPLPGGGGGSYQLGGGAGSYDSYHSYVVPLSPTSPPATEKASGRSGLEDDPSAQLRSTPTKALGGKESVVAEPSTAAPQDSASHANRHNNAFPFPASLALASVPLAWRGQTDESAEAPASFLGNEKPGRRGGSPPPGVTLVKGWRDDGRCGAAFSAPDGLLSRCPASPAQFDAERTNASEPWLREAPCCAFVSGWCGGEQQHCDCEGCVDYRKTVTTEENDTLTFRPPFAGADIDFQSRCHSKPPPEIHSDQIGCTSTCGDISYHKCWRRHLRPRRLRSGPRTAW